MLSSLSFSRAQLKEAIFVFGAMALGLFVMSVFGIDPAHAQLIDPSDSPDNVTAATGGEGSFKNLARQMVNFFWYFLGFIATIMVIYGGVLYVTSAGSDGAGGCLFQPLAVSQSRTNCLSKAGGDAPGR